MTVICEGIEYATIREAMIYATNGSRIFLDSDMEEDVEVLGRKNVVIDLAGHTLRNKTTHTVTVLSTATLTIDDSVGGGVVDCITHARAAVICMNGGSCRLVGGKFTRSKEDSTAGSNSWYVIMNYGTMTISGSVVIEGTSTFSSAVRNGFDTSKADEMAMYDGRPATMAISGGSVTSGKIAVKNDEMATLTISGGNLTCTNEALLNWSSASIMGGTLESTAKETVWNGSYKGSGGILDITGGIFKAPAGVQPVRVLTEADGSDSPTRTSVSGGSFSTAPDTQYLAPGFVISTGSDGLPVIIHGGWDLPDEGMVGGGFNGWRRLIIRKTSVDYTAGGIDIPDVGASEAVLLGVSAKGGLSGYWDSSAGKLVLYKGTKEVTGTIDDLSVIFLCH